MSKDMCRCGSVNLLVYLLVIFFGISSWVDINGLFVELPILVQNLPEGWDLPSYMSVIIQVANVAPLMYTVASTLWPQRKFEIPVIYIIICLGGVACLLLAFLWNVTSQVAGREHSTALFVLQLCLALVDCTSSVAFLPYMSLFKPQYMTAYFIGEGFSGLIPSLVALGQGAGSMTCVSITDLRNYTIRNETDSFGNISNMGAREFDLTVSTSEPTLVDVNHTWTFTPSSIRVPVYQEPRFSVKIFFLQLMLLMIVSSLSFTLLNFWSYCKTEQVQKSSELWINSRHSFTDSDVSTTLIADVGTNSEQVTHSTCKGKNTEKHMPMFNKKHNSYRSETKSDTLNSVSLFHLMDSKTKKPSFESNGAALKPDRRKMSNMKYALFLLLTAFLNAISNGLLPSIQTYSCLPYGIEQYHLSVTLANIANPVACFVSFLQKMKSVAATLIMSLVGMGLTGYIVWTAYTSPTPPLVNHWAGPVVLILCWVLVVFVLTYTKVSIATEFREEGKKALLWVGASSQAGSLLGAVSIFLVVSVFKLFQTGNPCL